MQLGWVPPNYTIDIPDDEDDSMMEDIQEFLYCLLNNSDLIMVLLFYFAGVEKNSNTNEDTFLYPKYQVIQKFQKEENARIPIKVVDLALGTLVIVIDKDEDG